MQPWVKYAEYSKRFSDGKCGDIMESAIKRKIRVLLTKFDLESHDRGIFLVSKMLQDGRLCEG